MIRRVPAAMQQRGLALSLLAIVASGVSIAIAPLRAVVGLGAAALSLFALLFARRILAWRGPYAGATIPLRSSPEAAVPRSSLNEFRASRAFYYLGVLAIGVLTLRPVFGLTLSDIFFLFALVALVLESASQGGLRAQLPKGVTYGVAIFAVGGLISSYSAQLPSESLGIVARMIYITLMWFWLGTVVIRTPRQVRTAIALWVASAAITGGAAIVQLLAGDVIPGASITWGRMTGFTGQVNELGGVASVAVVPALMVASRARNLATVVSSYAGLVLIGVGLVLSGSVSGMLAAAVGTLFWIGLVGVRSAIAVTLVSIGLGVAVLFSTQSSAQVISPLQRLDRVIAANDPSATFWTRMEVNGIAWARIVSSPLVGVGLDSQSSLAIPDSQVHNSLLGSWYEAGLLGFIGFGTLLITVMACARKAANRARDLTEWGIVVGLLASCVSWITYGMANPVLYKRYGWIPAVLILCLRTQQMDAIESSPGPQTEASRRSSHGQSSEQPHYRKNQAR